MNPLSMVTGAITHPVQTAGSVAGQALGVAASGVKTTARVIGWATQGRSRSQPQTRWPEPTGVARPTLVDAAASSPTPTPQVTATPGKPDATKAPAQKAAATTAPATKAPAKKAAGKKAPAKKARAKKAPSAKAATAGPALAAVAKATGDEDLLASLRPDAVTETDQPEPEPLLDPSTVKAVRSETEVLQRASDPDKG